jgi:20S proteasome alpha/beta subunit
MTMRKQRHCCRSLLLLLLSAAAFQECSCSSAARAFSISAPIENLEASVAASSAHGSVAAVSSQNQEEHVVIISFKPSETESVQQTHDIQKKPPQKKKKKKFGLKLSNTAVSRKQFGTSSISVMTGFAADVKHLTGVTLNQEESYQSLYSQAMTVDRIVRKLSCTIQQAARPQGGRPYGVQALIVGLDHQRKFQLYTVDPAGGWQHYGGGATAIGRGAPDIRSQLYKTLKKHVTKPSSEEDCDASKALRIAITSLVGKDVKDNDGDTDYTNKLEALLVWKSDSGSCCVSRIDDSEVDACLKLIKGEK